MKKLIVLASTAMLSCAVSAASFTWGFYSDSIIKPDGGDDDFLEGGTALLYLGTVTATDKAFNTDSAKYITSAGQSSATYNFGVFDGQNNPASSDLVTSTAAGQAYTLILLDKDGITDLAGYNGKYILATGVSGQDTDPMTGTTWATFVNKTTYTGSDWQTMPTPEPTSGLLILIGMAGLALRRKQK